MEWRGSWRWRWLGWACWAACWACCCLAWDPASIISAINVGDSKPFLSSAGIRYAPDPDVVENQRSIKSDYITSRVAIEDRPLYQNCRYAEACGKPLVYKVSGLRKDGPYVIVLQWAEYRESYSSFNLGMKISLNGAMVFENLDINVAAGLATAFEETISIHVHARGTLLELPNRTRIPFDGTLELTLESLSGCEFSSDRAFLCGLYVMQGLVEDAPLLPPVKSFGDTHDKFLTPGCERWCEASGHVYDRGLSETEWEDKFADARDILLIPKECTKPHCLLNERLDRG